MLIYDSIMNDLDEKVYRAEKAISQSSIREFKMVNSPYKYEKQSIHGRYFSPGSLAAMELGTVFHSRMESLIKEQDFSKSHVKQPAGMRKGTKAFEKWKTEKALRKTIVTDSVWNTTDKMVKELLKSNTVRSLLNGAEAEVSLFFKEDSFNQKCKGRIDALNKNHKVAIDFKSCMSADPYSPQGFLKSIRNGLYSWQAAFYIDALKRMLNRDFQWLWISSEKIYPYSFSITAISDSDLSNRRTSLLP